VRKRTEELHSAAGSLRDQTEPTSIEHLLWYSASLLRLRQIPGALLVVTQFGEGSVATGRELSHRQVLLEFCGSGGREKRYERGRAAAVARKENRWPRAPRSLAESPMLAVHGSGKRKSSLVRSLLSP